MRKKTRKPLIPTIIAIIVCAIFGITNQSDINRLISVISETGMLAAHRNVKIPEYSPKITEMYSGEVVKVYDGDTIHVKHKGKTRKIRLHGIDAPETTQEYGIDARNFLRDKIDGKTVIVQVTNIDKYNRDVAWVQTKKGEVINEISVECGNAWHYKAYAENNKKLADLQEKAKKDKLGL